MAVDTNLLVYAHRKDSTWHDAAPRCVEDLAEGQTTWAIPRPAIHEFLPIANHPLVFKHPTPVSKAMDRVSAWLDSPSLALLSESGDYWAQFSRGVTSCRVRGPQIHDARIAALYLHHGVECLWTADRDFGRFPDLKTRNPLID